MRRETQHHTKYMQSGISTPIDRRNRLIDPSSGIGGMDITAMLIKLMCMITNSIHMDPTSSTMISSPTSWQKTGMPKHG